MSSANAPQHTSTGPLGWVCAKLGVGEAELPLLPAAFLQDAISNDAAATLQEKAAAFLAMAAATPNENLSKFFRDKDEAETYPWKKSEKRAALQIEHFKKAFAQPNAFDELKKIFVAQAKSQQIAPIENVVCQYLLYGSSTDFARYTLASLLLAVPVANRLAIHNWNVASDMPAARREAYGSQIDRSPWPLFPEIDELLHLNSRMLGQVPALTGGAAPPEDGIFARRDADTLWGGGAAAIYGPDGRQTHALDTSTLVSELRAEIAFLRTRGPQQQRGRGRGDGRGQGRTHPQPRGRGRGRGYWGAGAESDPANDQQPEN